MTTPRDEATALLAEAMEATVDLDPTTPVSGSYPEAGGVYLNWNDVIGAASSILAASPTLAADLEFAIAWRRVERALPEGHLTWEAYHMWSSSAPRAPYRGPTPTAALTRLAEALEPMR